MDDDPVCFPRLGGGFTTRIVTLAPGSSRAYDDAVWCDALVVVESGEVELECQAGGRGRFGRGAVLWLTELGLRALHNHGGEAAVLVAIARRHHDERTGH